MTTLAPARARQSYRHEAFLWHGREDFVRGLLPFIHDGIDAGEAVMVATVPERGEWLANALGARASRVHFVDLTQLGHNPARIIPAWLEFLEDWSGLGRPARGIGEPIWDGRRPEEVVECQLHESLLNLAIDPEMPFWLVCPYDGEHLDEDVLSEASRSHPMITTVGAYHGSPDYGGQEHARALFAAELPDLAGQLTELEVTRPGLAAALERVTLQAAAGDLGSDKVVSLSDVVRRLSDDRLDRGARQLTVRLWDAPDAVVCDVADSTGTDDLLVGRHPSTRAGQDVIWLANQVCDLVQVRSRQGTTTVRIHLRK